MSRKEPPIIMADDIQFVEYPYALVRSMSQDGVIYNVNYEERNCDCNSYIFCRKEPKTCKHVVSVLRLLAIKRSRQE